MQTPENLKRRIDSTEDLQSVVKTMKSLAAVNIRQYEKAVESLKEYSRAIDMALGIVLRHDPDTTVYARSSERKRIGAFVFGSDQGMCGSLNERVVSHAMETLRSWGKGGKGPADIPVVCAGERASGILADAGIAPVETWELPGSVTSITPHVQEILLKIEQWREQKGVDHVMLFHARQESRAGYKPRTVRLLPVDARWLHERRKQKWESRSLPFFTLPPDTLFSSLIREYLFMVVFRAYVESMASENAARLTAMQGAEKNIEELMEDLTGAYHRLRQMSITEELLDIVSGFEALEQG